LKILPGGKPVMRLTKGTANDMINSNKKKSFKSSCGGLLGVAVAHGKRSKIT